MSVPILPSLRAVHFLDDALNTHCNNRLLLYDVIQYDSDLAEIHGVETRARVQAVKRNKSRFPDDLMFPLTRQEFQCVRSQNVMSNSCRGRDTLPCAFTELKTRRISYFSSVIVRVSLNFPALTLHTYTPLGIPLASQVTEWLPTDIRSSFSAATFCPARL
jgi:hypothetical protein